MRLGDVLRCTRRGEAGWDVVTTRAGARFRTPSGAFEVALAGPGTVEVTGLVVGVLGGPGGDACAVSGRRSVEPPVAPSGLWVASLGPPVTPSGLVVLAAAPPLSPAGPPGVNPASGAFGSPANAAYRNRCALMCCSIAEWIAAMCGDKLTPVAVVVVAAFVVGGRMYCMKEGMPAGG